MRRDPDGRHILRGGPARALTKLALPVILGEAVHTAYHLVDVIWVGPIGVEATGALMVSTFALWMAMALGRFATVGLGAHVSQRMGAGDREGAARAASEAMALALLLGVVTGAIFVLGAERLFELLETDERTSQLGVEYLVVCGWGMPITFAYTTFGSVMSACGNTRTPLRITAVALLANGLLTPFLIYGIGPFPELGIAGSALASIGTLAGAVAVYAALLAKGHGDLPWSGRSFLRPRPRGLLAIARVGAPYGSIIMIFSVQYLWFAHLAAIDGPAAVAVVGIANRLEALTYSLGVGFTVACSTFVGQNLGAEQPARAWRGTYLGLWMMVSLATVVGLAFVIAPAPLVALFTSDVGAIELGVAYLVVLAICQPFQGAEGPIHGAFAGAGDTVPPMLLNIVMGLLRMPLAYWAVVPLAAGVVGLAWVITATTIIRALALFFWFRRGAWAAARVVEHDAGRTTVAP